MTIKILKIAKIFLVSLSISKALLILNVKNIKRSKPKILTDSKSPTYNNDNNNNIILDEIKG